MGIRVSDVQWYKGRYKGVDHRGVVRRCRYGAYQLVQVERHARGIEDEVNYPGPIARIADDGQSMVMYLEPRANEWLCHTLKTCRSSCD